MKKRCFSMLTVQTKYAGDVTVDQDKIITFPSGLPGFKHETKFILLPLPSIPADVFQTLQSVNTPHLAFVVANPYHFYQDYEFRLNEPTLKHLRISHEKDVLVLAIVTLKSPFEKSTLNLKAPLIINLTLKLGKQLILTDEDYPMKAPLKQAHISRAKGES